ncbi:MAG: type IX secretion system membrane protein PorP/SprF [Bacteroidota bacterium]|nr:type IX secretion system membrane protein PorP/SprF [Bacteroidota bacterium]
MKYLSSLLLILISVIVVNAQQDPQFAHNMYNNAYTNPAYAGTDGGICAHVINRQQWVGFEGAPNTTVASVTGAFNIFNIPSGVGISILDDRIGNLQNFQIKLSYAYRKRVGAGTLSFGMEAGLLNKNLDGQWDPPESPDDPQIPQDVKSKMVPDLGVGFFYNLTNQFYLGASVSHVHQPKIEYTDAAASLLRRHYYATAGYNHRLFNSPIELKPSVFVKFDGTQLQYSINMTALYNKKFWLGVSYRDKDAISPMAGVQLLNGLRVGYSYELSLSKMITASGGSHEVFIGYCFDFWRPNRKYKYRSIRYL